MRPCRTPRMPPRPGPAPPVRLPLMPNLAIGSPSRVTGPTRALAVASLASLAVLASLGCRSTVGPHAVRAAAKRLGPHAPWPSYMRLGRHTCALAVMRAPWPSCAAFGIVLGGGEDRGANVAPSNHESEGVGGAGNILHRLLSRLRHGAVDGEDHIADLRAMPADVSWRARSMRSEPCQVRATRGASHARCEPCQVRAMPGDVSRRARSMRGERRHPCTCPCPCPCPFHMHMPMLTSSRPEPEGGLLAASTAET